MFLDALSDTLNDSLKLLPFLFFTYVVLEYLEAKMNGKTISIIQKSGRFGPLIGAVLGIFPQCGFSAAATNLYASRVITLGTLIAVYLSTSDEMLPILLAEAIPFSTIAVILTIKVSVAIFMGVAIDYFGSNKKHNGGVLIEKCCLKEKCNCDQGILSAAINHTLHIIAYITIFTFAFNFLILFIGEENLSNIIWNQPLFGELLAGLVGLIPNCAASVMLTKLYLEGALGLGALVSGLLVGAGVGLMVLFRVNADIKENLKIVGILYITGVIVGFMITIGT